MCDLVGERINLAKGSSGISTSSFFTSKYTFQVLADFHGLICCLFYVCLLHLRLDYSSLYYGSYLLRSSTWLAIPWNSVDYFVRAMTFGGRGDSRPDPTAITVVVAGGVAIVDIHAIIFILAPP